MLFGRIQRSTVELMILWVKVEAFVCPKPWANALKGVSKKQLQPKLSIDLAVLALAPDHADLKGITLTTSETTHAHGTTPFGDINVLYLKVGGAKVGWELES